MYQDGEDGTMAFAPSAVKLLNKDVEKRTQVFKELVELASNEPYRGQELCRYLSDFTGEPGVNYDGKLFQRWYVWRYYIAYIYEYAHMYTDVLKDLEDASPSLLNVLSIGCGMGVDYRGLQYARNELVWPKAARLSVDYMGVDLAPWDKDLLACGLPFDRFRIATSTDIVEYLASKVALARLGALDVLVFPKSLGDLPDEAVRCVAHALASHGPQAFYLCNVPPCGKRLYAGGANSDSWTNRQDIERKRALLFETLRESYDLAHEPTPLFEGIQHDEEDRAPGDEEFKAKTLPWAFGECFKASRFEGDFKGVFPQYQVEKLRALCQHACGESCSCWEGVDVEPKLHRAPIMMAGRLSYEVYKLERKAARA